jgi:AcrR family transcriptional regulator
VVATRGDIRREQILEAALEAFLEFGYAGTTIGEIRRRSGATTGSIYHFFASKAGLAHALLVEAIEGWSALSKADSDHPEDQVKASVNGLLQWGMANPLLFRLMDELRTLSSADEGFAQISELFAEGQTRADAAYRRYVRAGAVKPLPWAVAHSLMLGPAYNYLRLTLARPSRNRHEAAAMLVDAAWDAVRTGGRSRKGSGRPA